MFINTTDDADSVTAALQAAERDELARVATLIERVVSYPNKVKAIVRNEIKILSQFVSKLTKGIQHYMVMPSSKEDHGCS